MLLNAICTELGATLFDLTATNIVGKYPGKSGLNMLLHLVSKVKYWSWISWIKTKNLSRLVGFCSHPWFSLTRRRRHSSKRYPRQTKVTPSGCGRTCPSWWKISILRIRLVVRLETGRLIIDYIDDPDRKLPRPMGVWPERPNAGLSKDDLSPQTWLLIQGRLVRIT